MRNRSKLQVLTVLAAALMAAGCAPAAEEPAAASGGSDNCARESLKTLTTDRLTFGTDQPAYPPWFVDDDPASGEGYESAVAYAVAEKLGYDKTEVTWVRVPFNAAIAPGVKTFDGNLSEFSITDERKQAVDFSSPYYDVTQAVVTSGASPAAGVENLEGLRPLRLGAQVGTTSYTAAEALGTTQPISVYNNNEDAKAALLSGQIDAVVLDLPTAFAVQAELDDGVIVGQLPATADTPEQFGIVLDKGSPLTSCVSSAVDELRSEGTLAELQQQWLDEAGSAPHADVTALAEQRRAYHRSRARRSTLVALASTLVFAVVIAVTLASSPGWPRVQESFFDLRIGWDSLPAVLDGLWLNVRVLVVCEILILVLGLTLAALRSLRGPVWFPVRALVIGYVDLFRGLPLLICLYLIGFGLPGLRLEGVPNNPVLLGGLALVLVYSAFVAEVFRGGIDSVHPSQIAAARSLGLSHGRTMRLVVMPQAARRVTPALLNDFVALQKDCGLISVLGAVDAVRAAQIQVATSYNFTPYVVAGLLFVALAVPLGAVGGLGDAAGSAAAGAL